MKKQQIDQLRSFFEIGHTLNNKRYSLKEICGGDKNSKKKFEVSPFVRMYRDHIIKHKGQQFEAELIDIYDYEYIFQVRLNKLKFPTPKLKDEVLKELGLNKEDIKLNNKFLIEILDYANFKLIKKID